ncbi:DUF1398 domain-containing protein [Flavobacterium sp. NST-5]|uniref:DUF1398 domain-containing protein n=1 Tax=Flavobacterium ichthyis TaxID=2698827 RepID=A0ABW9ZAW3_9FLAO|nr:DUF1398 family protein [Flavobacterium ichthyis]NBL64215.1 DUF1398 domain-containing protein [Flavobacterium ichthyis]
MFTILQIKDAHSKVKSGADFPAYVREIKNLGVTGYQYFVTDGRSEYFGTNDYQQVGEAKYDVLKISEITNSEQFKADLKLHQQGNTDFITFCNDCAKSGIEKWVLDLNEMTCTYFDSQKNTILVENIPQ